MSETHITEIIKNVVETVALIAGAGAYVNWLYTRKDRAASVLIELETMFLATTPLAGRGLLEDPQEFEKLAKAISKAIAQKCGSQKEPDKYTAEEGTMLEQLDALLRFYVLLRGIREARQVPDNSLRLCYAHWLNFYFHEGRTEFRAYVDEFYPSLKKWIDDDAGLDPSERFFRPDRRKAA